MWCTRSFTFLCESGLQHLAEHSFRRILSLLTLDIAVSFNLKTHVKHHKLLPSLFRSGRAFIGVLFHVFADCNDPSDEFIDHVGSLNSASGTCGVGYSESQTDRLVTLCGSVDYVACSSHLGCCTFSGSCRSRCGG